MASEETKPKTIDESILSYLKDHEDAGEFAQKGETALEWDSNEQMRYIMRELLIKINKRLACKEKYENLTLWHNQYPLFDMENFIPDFNIDDDMIKMLSFRETVLISELDSDRDDSRECTPNPIGSLCLNIDGIHSVLPEGVKRTCTDQELELEVLQTLQRAKHAAGPLSEKPSSSGGGGKPPPSRVDDIEAELRKKVDEFEETLKMEMYDNALKLVVHLSSQFTSGPMNGGSRITAWIDRKLHTLEEKRTEYVDFKTDRQHMEKSLYVGLQRRKYYLRHAFTLNDDEPVEERKYYSLAKARNLMGEGANFVLMRYLAITQYKGDFELSTTYINGNMCRNIYECTGPLKGTVNGQQIDICKIYRCIIEECGLQHSSCTTMTIHGRIVTQEWDGCRIIINMNPLQHIKPGTPSPYDRLCLNQTWYDDLELFSKYLDVKTDVELNMKTFIADHPEVKNILADYLNNILLLKPDNILTFTINFFESLCPTKLEKLNQFN
ncbi:unnamed protein product [Phyllotreta striolata]|uniref:Ciliogenesis-associated TTC17-interacting protein N-terminal domain-containing protein n=1 Tax=Phyllotreta striolata TaxID=444603 RepID=A0A9N9TNZ8_PHYSR|nr:unnamed protein product [Phyllotreta striolata]